MQLTIQPTCSQRAPNDAANDAANDALNYTTNVQPTMQPTIQSQNESYPSFACDLQTHSTNSTTEPLDHQRLKEQLNLPTSQFIVRSPRVSEPIRFH